MIYEFTSDYINNTHSNNSNIISNNQTEEKNLVILSVKILFIFLTFILNGLVIFCFAYLIKEKTFSNVLFLLIAISDFLTAFGMIMENIRDNYDVWPLDKVSCYISMLIQYALPDTTVYLLLTLSLHRLLQIKRPLQTTEAMNFAKKILISLPWLFSFIIWGISLPLLVVNGLWTLKKCDINPPFLFVLIKLVFLGYIPLTLIISFNIISILTLNKKKNKYLNSASYKSLQICMREIKGSTDPTSSSSKSKPIQTSDLSPQTITFASTKSSKSFKLHKQTRAVVCIFSISLSIFITQIPYLIMWPIIIYKQRYEDYKCDRGCIAMFIYIASIWIQYLTSMCDALSILFFHERVKLELKKLMSKKFL